MTKQLILLSSDTSREMVAGLFVGFVVVIIRLVIRSIFSSTKEDDDKQ